MTFGGVVAATVVAALVATGAPVAAGASAVQPVTAVADASAAMDASAAVPAADTPPTGGGTEDAPYTPPPDDPSHTSDAPYTPPPDGSGTGDGGSTVDGPADGRGIDLAIAVDRDVVPPGEVFEVTITVRNYDDDGASDPYMGVSLSWDSGIVPLSEAGPNLWMPASGGSTAPASDHPVRPGDRCLVEGVDDPGPTAVGRCTARFKMNAVPPASIALTAQTWNWISTEEDSDGSIIAYAGEPVSGPAGSVAAVVEPGPLYLLDVDAAPFGAASGPDTVAEFTVQTTRAAVAAWRHAALEVVLRGPDGWTVSAAQEDLPGCVRESGALRCTIDPANSLPLPPESVGDTTPQTIAAYDVAFSPPGWSSPKEDLSAFTITGEGWYQYPVIGLAVRRTTESAGVSAAPAAPVVPTVPVIVPSALVVPSDGYEMPDEWFDAGSSPFATLAQVFPTTTEVDVAYTGPGTGNPYDVTFTVTHDEEVTTELPGVAVTFELSWPDFLTPTGDPVGCDEWVAPRCTIFGMDDPGIEQDVTMRFEVTGTGTARVELRGVDVTMPDGDGRVAFGPSWIVDSFDVARSLADVFITQVTLDRDATRVEGEPILATVRVQWAKALSARLRDAIFVQLELDWGDRVELVDPPGIQGCSELDGRVCSLTRWDRVGEVREITIELDPAAVGEVTVRATPVLVGFGEPNDYQEMALSWLAGDEASARVIDARFGIGLTLDRNPGYRGGQPLRATATVSRPSAPGVAPADDAPLRSSATTLDFTWPAYLTLTAVEGCPTFSGHRCVLTGLDGAGASAAVTLVFAMPAPITGDPDPRTDELTVAVAGASYDVVEASLPDPPPPPDPPGSECEIGFAAAADPCCPPGTDACPIPPLPEPVLTTVRTDAPPAWLDDDRASFSLLQPRAWITPAVANPGEVVTLHTRYLPPGEVVASQWRLPQPGQTASMPGVAVVGAPSASPGSTDVLLFRWTLAGPRAVTLSSTVGTFGAITSKPVLVAPRSAMAPNLVGRGG